MPVISFALTILGLLLALCLFKRLRFLSKQDQTSVPFPTVSVVIPARNEERSLDTLLKSLAQQRIPIHEIICVDDASEDRTSEVAKNYGVKLIRIDTKPAGWLGKSYACHIGAEAASGELLCFVDADVEFDADAFEALLTLQKRHELVSVQPKHMTKRNYEQLSLLFNLVAAASLGSTFPFGSKYPGLFGPVILLPKTVYEAVGGHEAIKGARVDDVRLGVNLKKAGVRSFSCLGGDLIRFRMYPEGLKSLQEGWTKNIATGAAKSSFAFILIVVLWISALIRIPLELGYGLAAANWFAVTAYVILYIVAALELCWAAGKVGQFKRRTAVLYPLPLLFFLGIFLLSLYKKLAARPIYWKGRDISTVD